MEWSDVYQSTSDPFLLSPLPPVSHIENDTWTFDENKIFEIALAKYGLDSPAFFENMFAMLPLKSMDQIKRHYECLLESIEKVEAGLIPIPKYVNGIAEGNEGDSKEAKSENGSSSKEAGKKSQQRKKGVPWTEKEHQLFLMGLNKYGKGAWKSISEFYVETKTPTQVASHAQKYFRRQNSTTPADRRRPSIHDIHTVDASSNFSSISSIPHNPNNIIFPITTQLHHPIPPLPLPNAYGQIHSNVAIQYPIFSQGDGSYSPMASSITNQTASGPYPSSLFQFPYPGP